MYSWASLPNPAPSNTTSVAWYQLWLEYLHHKNWVNSTNTDFVTCSVDYLELLKNEAENVINTD